MKDAEDHCGAEGEANAEAVEEKEKTLIRPRSLLKHCLPLCPFSPGQQRSLICATPEGVLSAAR